MDDEYPAEAYLDLPELLGPQLAPDGEHVAFLWNDTGRRELYVAPTDDNDEPRRLTDRDLRGWASGSDYWWNADGDGLYVLRIPHDDFDRASIDAITLDGQWTTVLDVDEMGLNWTMGDESALVGPISQETLLRYDPATGERRPIVEGGFQNFRRIRVRPDGEYVAFLANCPEDDPPHGTFVTSIDGDDGPEPIGREAEGQVLPVDWHDGGWLLIFDSVDARYGRYDPAARTVEWLVKAPSAASDSFSGGRDQSVGLTPDGEGILTLPDGELTVVNATTDLDVGLSAVLDADIGDEQLAVVTDRTDDRAPKLVTLAWPDGEPTTVFETTYGPVSPADDVSAEEYTYESSAGETKVLVHRPVTEPAPAVVFAYPRERLVEQFPRWKQYLLHRGYAVARPSIPNTDADTEADDLAAAGEWLAGREWIDGDRVAVFGHSSGGRETLIQAFTRDLWGAAVARAAPSHALPDVDNLAAPLRIHHPANDTVVPVERAREVRALLDDVGCVVGVDFEYAELPDGWHVTADVQQNADELARVVDFLERRL